MLKCKVTQCLNFVSACFFFSTTLHYFLLLFHFCLCFVKCFTHMCTHTHARAHTLVQCASLLRRFEHQQLSQCDKVTKIQGCGLFVRLIYLFIYFQARPHTIPSP